MKTKIVTLCGSTRFKDEFLEKMKELTLEGCIVLMPGVFGYSGDAVTDEQKKTLDILHLKKIEMSDEVFVINKGGYIGDSTRNEIAYAEAHMIPVKFLEEPGLI